MKSPTEPVKGDQRMLHFKIRFAFSALLTVAVFLAASLLVIGRSAHAQAPSQSTFASPQDALQALVSAGKAKDRAALAKVYGPDYDRFLSGDEVEDANDLGKFAEALGESA